jgi:hypothetical protein
MGTSSRYGGQRPSSALIPTFLEVVAPNDPAGGADQPGGLPRAAPNENPNEGTEESAPQNDPPAQQLPPLPSPGSAGRFRTARNNFNTYASTGDRQALSRSLSSYVRKGAGGSRGASRRMGSSIPAAGRVLGFVQDIARAGVNQALSNLGVGNLVGQLAEHALAALTDVFCPAGGPIDQGIARDAWDEAVLGLTDAGITDITEITAEQWQALVGDFIANSIETKVINDVGTKGISLPQDIRAINQLQSNLYQLIRGAVDDAIGDRLNGGQTIPQADIQAFVTDIYERSFAYLEALEE